MGQTNAQSVFAKSVEPGVNGGLNFYTLNRDLDGNAETIPACILAYLPTFTRTTFLRCNLNCCSHPRGVITTATE